MKIGYDIVAGYVLSLPNLKVDEHITSINL
jgi:hypothetical protein